MSNPIRRAIDGNLVALRVTERDVDRIMSCIRQSEQSRVRRPMLRSMPRLRRPVIHLPRLRPALVMAMLAALVMISGAVFMLRTPSDLINDGVQIAAGGFENGQWLGEGQVRKLLALARSNDITLTASCLSRVEDTLEKNGGYWAETLLSEIRGDRSDTLGTWSQEEADWFNATIQSLRTSQAEGRDRDPLPGELSYEEALERARAYVREVYPTAPLEDAQSYAVDVEFFDGESTGAYEGYYWRVDFTRRVLTVPEVALEFSADGKQLYAFDSWDGIDDAATDRDIWWAFNGLYGDMNTWTQSTWRAFVSALKVAENNGVKIERVDFCSIMQTEYPDIPSNVMSAEDAKMIAMKVLGLYQNPSAEVKSCMYIGDDPNPVWKVTVREYRHMDGYENEWCRMVELDSTNAQVKAMDECAEASAYRYMYTLHRIYGATLPDIPDEAYVSVSAEKARMSVVAYLQERYGETRDLNNEALFDVTAEETFSDQIAYNIQWLVTFDAKQAGEVGYWAYVDGFGNVLDAGVDDGAGTTVDSIRFAAGKVLGVYPDNFRYDDFLETVRKDADKNDPVVQLLRKTNYEYTHEQQYWATREMAQQAATEAVGYRFNYMDEDMVYVIYALIDSDSTPGLVWKFAIQCDKGNYLVEVDNDTSEVLSAIEVKNVRDPWYAPILLQSDMEAAGIAPQLYTQPANNGLVVDEGCIRGMRLKHIYLRFGDLYGFDPLGWSQAQLASFQRAVSESCSLACDLGAVCMQDTSYPSVPEGAISCEAAAEAGAQALALTDYEVSGSVLIADVPNAVWKVCYRVGNTYKYAEVDCMTGEGKTTVEHGEESYWFQGIILERVIHDHEATFHSLGNG